MNSVMTLPLFPLNTVLFPGQVLPLHIFEPLEKQDLLTSPSIVSLLSKEVGLLKREARMMQVMLGSRGRPTEVDRPIIFSAN